MKFVVKYEPTGEYVRSKRPCISLTHDLQLARIYNNGGGAGNAAKYFNRHSQTNGYVSKPVEIKEY